MTMRDYTATITTPDRTYTTTVFAKNIEDAKRKVLDLGAVSALIRKYGSNGRHTGVPVSLADGKWTRGTKY